MITRTRGLHGGGGGGGMYTRGCTRVITIVTTISTWKQRGCQGQRHNVISVLLCHQAVHLWGIIHLFIFRPFCPFDSLPKIHICCFGSDEY